MIILLMISTFLVYNLCILCLEKQKTFMLETKD